MATILSNFTRLYTTSVQATPGVPSTGGGMRRTVPGRQSSWQGVDPFLLSKEPEDAPLTGGTRSLERRLLALNVSGSFAKLGASLAKPDPVA
jgi:hypothetical protein